MIIDARTAAITSIPIRRCPFCGSEAHLVTAGQIRYGVQCSVCRACFLPVHRNQAEALMLWNRRSGGVSAAGGRATKGVSTTKKRRASRRNLALARKARRLVRIKSDTEDTMALLGPIRQAEIA